MQRALSQIIETAGQRCGYSKADLDAMHVSPHSLHASFAAYSEAMEWDLTRQYALGRWKLPIVTAGGPIPKKRAGAGSMKPKTIVAVYSTMAACQKQLELRSDMISALSHFRFPRNAGASLAPLM